MIKIDFIDTDILTEEMFGVKEWIRDFVKSYGKEVGELYYSFCSDEYLYKMNVELLGHDFYTDIITFPLNECETILSAEFHISIDRIKENAVTFNRSFRDELHRVMAHGVLHLIGFDDLCEDDEKQMREEEEKCLMMRVK
ncbi:MAG: rRNA maturation RNase YbeY [Lentimicrobiaceae bacterium]|nr:rRNA maturation RNase YbeY [Lentimicrobiaceae bacterium]